MKHLWILLILFFPLLLSAKAPPTLVDSNKYNYIKYLKWNEVNSQYDAVYINNGQDAFNQTVTISTSAYIAGRLDIVTGGNNVLFTTPTDVYFTQGWTSGDNCVINATKRIYLDGGGDTYFAETSANTVDFYVGGVNTLELYTTGGVAHFYPSLAAGTGGVVAYSGGQLLYVVSARKYKKDIIPYESCLNKIMRLETSRFKMKSDNSDDIGLIADDVLKIMPELVVLKDGQPESIKYYQLAIPLLKAFQEYKIQTDKEIKDLTTRIENLENK